MSFPDEKKRVPPVNINCFCLQISPIDSSLLISTEEHQGALGDLEREVKFGTEKVLDNVPSYICYPTTLVNSNPIGWSCQTYGMDTSLRSSDKICPEIYTGWKKPSKELQNVLDLDCRLSERAANPHSEDAVHITNTGFNQSTSSCSCRQRSHRNITGHEKTQSIKVKSYFRRWNGKRIADIE